jgi:hypothetical protein
MIRRGGSKQSMTFSFLVAPPVVAQDPLVYLGEPVQIWLC